MVKCDKMRLLQATPTPQMFNPDDFLASLSSSGPQLTTGIKGDWVGLYKRFFRSPNFSGWFHTRYTELSQQLQAKQLEKLSQAVRIKKICWFFSYILSNILNIFFMDRT